jgi:hypothetical protein
VLRNTPFVAELHFDEDPDQTAKALLAACVLSLRRAGTGRNRGRGQLTARLYDQQGNDITGEWFEHFRRLVKGGTP